LQDKARKTLALFPPVCLLCVVMSSKAKPKARDNMVTITIRMPHNMRDRLRKIATAEGRPESAQIRHILNRELMK
jgi:hypothetical protein